MWDRWEFSNYLDLPPKKKSWFNCLNVDPVADCFNVVTNIQPLSSRATLKESSALLWA